MNIAIVLSGGTGTRMKMASVPKQYIEINGKPIIGYALDVLQKDDNIDKIVIVCNVNWETYLNGYMHANNIGKFVGFAPAGSSRQESILNGLKLCKTYASDSDIIIIHDAARPFISSELIERIVVPIKYGADGVLPVLTVKDTVYYSEDGKSIGQLLNRDKLYCGQAPESFVFGKYFDININASATEISETRGSCEIAFKHGLKVDIVEGDEKNYKITTAMDLKKFVDDIAEA